MPAKNLEEIVSFCKRRGFIFQSSELYGGLQGVYDYGPLGVELKNNLKAAWWRSNVYERDDIVGLDSAILSHQMVFRYSGHEQTFSDNMVDCYACQRRWRVDHLVNGKCEFCGSDKLTEPRPFNMMFKTRIGPVENDESAFAYLRPETAQGIFVNFKNIVDSTFQKLPFGVAQIGKAFRNEITPRNFIFRVREFEQMEIEFFVKPGEDESWHDAWVQHRLSWWHEQGLAPENLELFIQPQEELAHYAKKTVDILYRFPHGLEELEGIANRTDYDLGSHTKDQSTMNLQAKVTSNTASVSKLNIVDAQTKESVVPFVIEPSAGVDRGVLAILTQAYTEELLEEDKKRIVLKLKPHLAPVKAAVMPLAKNNPEIVSKALAVRKQLQSLGVGKIAYEDTGNIGKNYRRHDEIGTPLCITIDFETIGKDGDPLMFNTVTVRHRDTMTQERIPIDKLQDFVRDFL